MKQLIKKLMLIGKIIHLDAVGYLVRSLKHIMGPKKSLMKLANISKHCVVCFVSDRCIL